MVNLNITLLVELGLFLLFLWVTTKIIIRPALATMDRRSAQIEGDRASANDHVAEADRLRTDYNASVNATRKTDEACRQALSHRVAAIAERRRHGRHLVEEVRTNAEQQRDAQRPQYTALAAQLAETLAAFVTKSGRAR